MKAPTAARPTLVTSSRREVALGATLGRKRAPATSTKAPTGTLTRKIIRQPLPSRSTSMSTPETTGPRIAASPQAGPRMPNALPISCGWKRSRISPKTWGTMIAPSPP
jgi:hypothetical protein